MSGIFQLKNAAFQIAPGTKIIKKEELASFYEANALLDKAQSEASELKRQAEIDYKTRYDEGYSEGKAEGQLEYAEKTMDVVLGSLDSLSELEHKIVNVVIESVKKIIGEFDPEEVSVRVVKNTLAAVRGENRVTVRISQDDEKAVREALADYLISSDGGSGYIEVLGDPQLKHADCVIETSLGIIDGSLNSQLNILERVMKAHVGENKE